MSTNDTIYLNGVKFNIVQRVGNRILVQWLESSGINKVRWIIWNGK